MSNNSGVYFLTGLAAGVAVVILFARHSGVETRDLIGRKAEEGKESLKEEGLRLKRQAMAMRQRATDLMEQGKDAFKEEKDRLAYAIYSGVSAYKNAPTFAASQHS